MKIAIPHWQGRVSPVLDTAGKLLLLEAGPSGSVGHEDVPLLSADPARRAMELLRWGVEVVVCGAVSRPLEMALASAGVTVVPNVCGAVEDVLAAFLSGQLDAERFSMPGCRGRRCRFRGGRRRGARNGGPWRRGDFHATR